MVKKTLFIAILAALAGCAEVSAIRSSIGLYGANASDQALESAIWTVCSASPVGAIQRRFKTEDEKAAREVICRP